MPTSKSHAGMLFLYVTLLISLVAGKAAGQTQSDIRPDSIRANAVASPAIRTDSIRTNPIQPDSVLAPGVQPSGIRTYSPVPTGITPDSIRSGEIIPNIHDDPARGKGEGSPIEQARSAQSSIIAAEMSYLAGDSMRGRKSGSIDELRAARYVSSVLSRYGVQPSGDSGSYIHHARINDTLQTWNVYALLPGKGALKDEVILLTAHLDHLGIGKPVGRDSVYNGADDDASGVIAVLELARIFSLHGPYDRTIAFVLFGTEEIGGFGDRDFLSHPPFPLNTIVANLEFEMIGRPDSAVGPRTLWLTGFERSDLGDSLARHGAKLVKDPHPEQQFFRRSDNFALAKKGIIAHTVSSFGLHNDYHEPSDEPSRIDIQHMADAISSMTGPIGWLANTPFTPHWKKGLKP